MHEVVELSLYKYEQRTIRNWEMGDLYGLVSYYPGGPRRSRGDEGVEGLMGMRHWQGDRG
jgi:hypothetical protein